LCLIFKAWLGDGNFPSKHSCLLFTNFLFTWIPKNYWMMLVLMDKAFCAIEKKKEEKKLKQ
jgi:hypothetical protein